MELNKSLIDMEKDILNHPENDLEYLEKLFSEESLFSKTEIEDINSAFKAILNDKNLNTEKRADYFTNSWKLNYFKKPPSPEEFLTHDWIGPMSESLFPHIKEAFVKFFDPLTNYRNLVLYYPIGAGKTTLVVLIKIYLGVLDYYLRNPKQFFRLAESTLISDVSVSLTKEQAYTLVINPMLNILETSPKFERTKFESQVPKLREQNPNTIYFANVNKGMAVLRMGDIRYNVVAEPSQLLGLTIQSASLTELGFLQEAGMSQEQIMRLLNDSKQRVYSRFGNHYLARTIVDSSPNDISNLVDKYIYFDCVKDPTVLRLNGTKWELQPYLFPEYEKHGTTFPVFKGNITKQPKILEKEEINNYDTTEIINMPIDIKQFAQDSLTKVLKDYAGIPAGSEAKLISNFDMIEDCFTDSLKNIYTYIHAPSNLSPEGLLWEIVKKEFFIYSGRGNIFYFYRNPFAQRFISVDLARNHDMATITMCHIELNKKGEKLYIIDFTLVIVKNKEEINMDAFRYLVYDMMKYGNINIKMASFDGFQSDTSIQFLNRLGIETIKMSVDYPVEPYMSFLSIIGQRRIKMGRNLIFKNNCKSLIMSATKSGKKKVDHIIGEWCDMDNLDWKTSKMGYFGKDLSDTVCASCTLADLYGNEYSEYIFDEKTEIKKDEIESIKDLLNDKYGLVLE